MTEEGSGARLMRNTLTNGASAVLGVVVFLVLTPILILQLGAEAYGVFTLALSLSFLGGYASFSDLGVEAATARFIAEARSDGDHDRVNVLASTTMGFFGAVAMIVAPITAAVSPLLVDLFDVDADLRKQAILCFCLVAAQLLFEMPARTYFAVLEGAQRFTAYQACEIVRLVAQATLFITAIAFELGIAGLGGALALSSLIVLILARHIAHRVMPDLRVSPRLARRDVLRLLLGYGGALLGFRVVITLYRQMDRFIVGAALGARYVTVFEIANKIQSAAQLVQSVSASALVPAAAYARGRLDVLQDMFLRGSAYTLAASLPVIGVVFIFAEPLITTWIDPKYASAATPTRLFAGYLLTMSVLIVGTTMVIALGHLRFMLAVNGPAVLLNLVLSLILVHPLGINGVVIATAISATLALPPQLRYFLRRFDLPLASFLRRVVAPQTPGALAQAATAAPLLWLANRSTSLVEVGALCLVSIGLSLLAFVTAGLRGEDRRALISALRQAVG